MYLHSITIKNFRKFRENGETIEFAHVTKEKSKKNISASQDPNEVDTINQEDEEIHESGDANLSQQTNDVGEINVASETTLIVGKNNVGKTTIVTALKMLINNESFKENDFNFHTLNLLVEKYKRQALDSLPYIEFGLKIGIDDIDNDLTTNIGNFITLNSNLFDGSDSDKTVEINVRYELVEEEKFRESISGEDSNKFNLDTLQLIIKESKFRLNYYNKNEEQITNFKLSELMEIKYIGANPIDGEHSLSDAFNRIIRYTYETDKLETTKPDGITKKINDFNNDLTLQFGDEYSSVLRGVISEIVDKSHTDLEIVGDLTEDKIFKNALKYNYKEGGYVIPENQYGLGYTNLMLIISNILDHVKKYKLEAFNSRINLIVIEEPEAFMHPQMQELFIKHINDAVNLLIKSNSKQIKTQIIITTHSSHILNSKIHSGNSFNNINYLYIESDRARNVSLKDELIVDNKTPKERDEHFKFIKKHIKYKSSELFFSDAVIVVEGPVEENIIPFYIDRDDFLNKYYISIFGISGAYAHIYKKLLDLLNVPTVIITDLDIKRSDRLKKKQINSLESKRTTNQSIIDLCNGSLYSQLPDKNLIFEKGKIGVVTQKEPIEGYYASSFEEALILTNNKNKILNNVISAVRPILYKEYKEKNDVEFIKVEDSYEWQLKLNNYKSQFINTLLYVMFTSDTNDSIPKLPEYIQRGFDFLKEKLNEK